MPLNTWYSFRWFAKQLFPSFFSLPLKSKTQSLPCVQPVRNKPAVRLHLPGKVTKPSSTKTTLSLFFFCRDIGGDGMLVSELSLPKAHQTCWWFCRCIDLMLFYCVMITVSVFVCCTCTNGMSFVFKSQVKLQCTKLQFHNIVLQTGQITDWCKSA